MSFKFLFKSFIIFYYHLYFLIKKQQDFATGKTNSVLRVYQNWPAFLQIEI